PQGFWFRIAVNADYHMSVVVHDRCRQQEPLPKPSGLPKLVKQDVRLLRVQEDRRLPQLSLHVPTETGMIGVVLGTRLVVAQSRSTRIANVADKPSCVPRQPGSIGRPGEQPEAIHESLLASGGR